MTQFQHPQNGCLMAQRPDVIGLLNVGKLTCTRCGVELVRVEEDEREAEENAIRA